MHIGLCLLEDSLGVEMDAIKADHYSVDDIMIDVFGRWLQGTYTGVFQPSTLLASYPGS